jgi:hypothetical protein
MTRFMKMVRNNIFKTMCSLFLHFLQILSFLVVMEAGPDFLTFMTEAGWTLAYFLGNLEVRLATETTSGRPKKKPRATQRPTKTDLGGATASGRHDSQHPEVDVPGGWRKVQGHKRKHEKPRSTDRGENTGRTKKSDRDDGKKSKKKRRAPAKKKTPNRRQDPDSSSSGTSSSSSSDGSSDEDFDD